MPYHPRIQACARAGPVVWNVLSPPRLLSAAVLPSELWLARSQGSLGVPRGPGLKMLFPQQLRKVRLSFEHMGLSWTGPLTRGFFPQ